jgi:hypothetical protein
MKQSIVMLSAAKHLAADRARPFAALRSSALNAREWGDTEGKHSRDATARQYCQVLLNLALESEYVVSYVYAQLY